MTLVARISAVVTRIAQEFKAVRLLRGASNGLAPLDANKFVLALNLPNAWARLVQNLPSGTPPTILPIDWRKGLLVNITMPSANLSPTVNDFQFPVMGEEHIIILKNSTGAPRNFVLPTSTAHRSNVVSIAVGNNQRRKLIGHFDGAVYDWSVETAKTL